MRIIAGPCQHETFEQSLSIAKTCKKICDKYKMTYYFKASYDKANRTSADGKRGIGLDQTMKDFLKLKLALDINTLTDVHTQNEILKICTYHDKAVDVLQIPAFLCRQTDLIKAACETKLPLNIKKGQFLSPGQMLNIINKCHAFDNENIILCERGSSFGYNNLIVDFLGISELKNFKKPVILDVTHSLQIPGGQGNAADGRSSQALDLALAGTAIGLAGLFIEVHPDPKKALCDGPSATRLDEIENILSKIKSIDNTVKSF